MFKRWPKIFILLVFWSVLNPVFGFSEPIIMRLALQTPEKNELNRNVMYFKDLVELNSNGAIKVEVYHSGEVTSDKEMPIAVGNGLLEAGVVSLNRYYNEIPAIDIFFQPFLLNSSKKLESSTRKNSIIRDLIDKAIEKTGSSVLWWQPYGSIVFVSDSEPIQTPDALEDKRVRVFSQTLADLAIVAKGSPVVVSNSGQYFSYKKNEVEIGMTLVSSIKSRSIWEVKDTITVSNHASAQFIVIVNSDWWNVLNFRNRNIITDAADKAEKKFFEKINELEAKVFLEAQEKGMSIFYLSQDDIEYWKEKSAPIYKKYIERSGSLGEKVFENAKQF